MKIYLVQHGLALTSDEDSQRPLSDEGARAVARMAEFAASAGIRPARIVHSGKLRAAQTAEIFAQELDPDDGVHQLAGLNPGDDVAAFAAAIMPDRLMVIGHLPFLARLASFLVTRQSETSVIKFMNSGIVCLERTESGAWQICGALTPEHLPGD